MRHFRAAQRAQSISEYVLMLGIISLVLVSIQLYMKRGIQAVIKNTADEIGNQKDGGQEYDFRLEHKTKGDSSITTTTQGRKEVRQEGGGQITYDTPSQTEQQHGILSKDIYWED